MPALIELSYHVRHIVFLSRKQVEKFFSAYDSLTFNQSSVDSVEDFTATSDGNGCLAGLPLLRHPVPPGEEYF